MGSELEPFSEEICYCTHGCCYLNDMNGFEIAEYERWSCYECKCHFTFEDHPLYDEYLNDKWDAE